MAPVGMVAPMNAVPVPPPVEQNLISVIMPCYNSAHYLAEAIGSVMNQAHVQTELIGVEDGSSDESVAVVRRLIQDHPDRIRLLEQGNTGPYPARNFGLSRARGEFIAFLDADDWWAPDCLEKLHAALMESQAVLAYCGWQNLGPGAPGTMPHIPPDHGEGLATVSSFLRSCPWPIHAALVRRTAIDAVRGFSTRRFTSMDYDLWLRLYAYDQRLVRVPEVLAFYRWHDHGQISKTKWRQVLDARMVRQDFINDNPALVNGLDAVSQRELINAPLLKEAYRAHWNRDLVSAQKLFRETLKHNAWTIADLKYLIPSLLPERLYRLLVSMLDVRSEVR